MRLFYLKLFILLLGISLPFWAKAQKVVILNLDAPIYETTAQYVVTGLQKAAVDNASFVVIKINTPGGLLSATQKIVGSILEAPIPIISFVTPAGAHAGSAGAFIALAANVCAMSPGTNLGASQPVWSGGTHDSIMNQKTAEGAAAIIRSIAEKRGRDIRLLSQMVTSSSSYTAQQALQNHTIDLIAENQNELLKKLNNYSIQLNTGATIKLQTSSALLVTVFEMNAKDKFLNQLNDPNIMYLLLLVGMMGILFEFFNPGGMAPGIVGLICLGMAAYGMSLLPINFTGLALILLAIVLFILELKFPSHALLSISGVACLFFGSVFLIDSAPSFDVVRISWSVLIPSIIVMAAFFIFLIGIGLKAQMQKPSTGASAMIGMKGITMEDLMPKGRVKVNGEFWDAVCENENISKGAAIEVVSIQQLQLTVKAVSLTSK